MRLQFAVPALFVPAFFSTSAAAQEVAPQAGTIQQEPLPAKAEAPAVACAACRVGDYVEVRLRHAEPVRGRLRRMTVGREVVVELRDGVVVVPWDQIVRLQTAALQTGEAAPGRTWVQLGPMTTQELVLYSVAGKGEPGVPVCSSPCKINVDGSDRQFYVAGPDVTKSPRFSLSGPGASIEADPGSSGVRGAGAALMVLGILGAVAGNVVTVVGVAQKYTNEAERQAKLDTLFTGLGVTGGGLGLLIIGGITFRAGRTTVAIDREVRPPRALSIPSVSATF